MSCRWTVFLLILVGLYFLPNPPAAGAGVKAYRGKIDIPTYPWWPPVKHPYFRGTDKVNIYPYPMLDNLSREKTNHTYQTVVLENEYLRVTFLPELGGKIHEVINKSTGQQMFYVNHVVKPGLIGQCGAWTSGGVEWNTGPQGHTVGCMQPVAVEILPPEKDGARSVAIGETERIYHTRWTVIVTLRPGRSFLEERIRIYNPTETIRPYYFWNCTAAANPPGFRFIYPMTLGTDHGAEKFFRWPIDHGKDLSRGTNYQDASSIFAWHCDQDFFGSYDDGADRGVVAYANHHQLPGKKAWTWGQGGFGKMHQMDLTDTDGPYNEVQTGPLLTQGEVGRLDPCEAVEWQEWWYPIHGLGGFTFANRDVAVNTTRERTNLKLRIMGTGSWSPVEVYLLEPLVPKSQSPKVLLNPSPRGRVTVSPKRQAEFSLPLNASEAALDSLRVQLRHGDQVLASFSVPLDLPKREPPEKPPGAQTAAQYAQKGWEAFLFAKFDEAEGQFRKALEKDPKSGDALTGLAYLDLDPDPKGAAEKARSALEVRPNFGLAHFALAVAQSRSEAWVGALDEAWEASLDTATAIAGRALVAKLETRNARYQKVLEALSDSGPWQTDPLCRSRLAFARLQLGDKASAIALAKQNLLVDPLDAFSASILWLAGAETKGNTLAHRLQNNPQALPELVAEYSELNQRHIVHRLFAEFLTAKDQQPDAVARCWARAFFQAWPKEGAKRGQGVPEPEEAARSGQRALPGPGGEGVFPHWPEAIPIFKEALAANPKNGEVALYLGHLLFHQGRHAEGREMWKRAAELGAEPVVAYRALGMAAKTLDGDLKTAREWLTKANQADRMDAIVARDLAKVLFAQAEKAGSDSEKRELTMEARDRLKAAFPAGKGRSDFVVLLAQAQNRLGEFADTARMLDSVRVTVWEGAREVHDLFEDAHLALGEAHLKAGRATEALAEFNRALDYPDNLATGKLENAREAHIHYLRGNALAALGRKPEALRAWKQAVDESPAKDARRQEARRKAQEALEAARSSP